MDFRNPSGSPGSSKRDEGHWQKTTTWRDLVPFCSFQCISLAADSILALLGHHFDTVWAQKKLPTGSGCSLSVSGPAECAKRFEFAVPCRGAGVLNPSGLHAGFPESLPLLTSPPDPRRPSIRTRGTNTRDFFRFFSAVEKTVKKRSQKIDFFRKFWRFWCLRRRCSVIFGLKTGPRRLLFRCFFESGDFVKIVLPL